MKLIEPTWVRVGTWILVSLGFISLPFWIQSNDALPSLEEQVGLDRRDLTLIEPMCWMDMGAYGRAEELLSGLVSNEPRFAEGWCLLGSCQVAQGRSEEAIDSLRHGLDLLPPPVFQILARFEWAKAEQALDRPQAAMAQLEQVLDRDPAYVEGLLLGVELARSLENAEREARYLESLLAEAPGHVDAAQWQERLDALP